MIVRVVIAAGAAAASLAAGPRIANERIAAEFGDRGLTNLRDRDAGRPFGFGRDGFAVTIDGKRYDSAALPAPKRDDDEARVAYEYVAGPFEIHVWYDIRPDGRFLSKQLAIRASTASRL